LLHGPFECCPDEGIPFAEVMHDQRVVDAGVLGDSAECQAPQTLARHHMHRGSQQGFPPRAVGAVFLPAHVTDSSCRKLGLDSKPQQMLSCDATHN
jgi:hypothetical protein